MLEIDFILILIIFLLNIYPFNTVTISEQPNLLSESPRIIIVDHLDLPITWSKGEMRAVLKVIRFELIFCYY